MGTHRDGRKEAVRLWIEISKERCGIKAVYEESSATAAPCVLEQMEKLYSTGIGLHDMLSKRKKPIVDESAHTKYVLSVCAGKARFEYAVSPQAMLAVKSQNFPSDRNLRQGDETCQDPFNKYKLTVCFSNESDTVR
jgi:hypothetical protein